MSAETNFIDIRLFDYLRANSLREPCVLKRLREETGKLSRSHMLISPEVGQLLTLLTRLIGTKRALDIGTFTGYSSIAIACGLPEDGRVYTFDVSNEHSRIREKYWLAAGYRQNVMFHEGDALIKLQEVLLEFGASSFDLALIDADKLNYFHYYDLCLKLVRSGGLIIIDNVLWGGKLVDVNFDDQIAESMKNFNHFLHKDERVDISMLPLGDGITIAYIK